MCSSKFFRDSRESFVDKDLAVFSEHVFHLPPLFRVARVI